MIFCLGENDVCYVKMYVNLIDSEIHERKGFGQGLNTEPPEYEFDETKNSQNLEIFSILKSCYGYHG